MINDFLATLDNDPTPPAGFVWPTFTARTFSSEASAVRSALIGSGLSRENKFARCLQLAYLVEESPLAPYVRARDPRVTYSKKSVRDRFRLHGSVILYTGSNVAFGQLSLILNPTTPAVAAWDVHVVDNTHIQVTDDLGRTVIQPVAFAGGHTGAFAAPAGVAGFDLTAAAPAVGDSWTVSYQAPGATWTLLALQRLERANAASVLSGDLATWYHKAPSRLDRLAAVIAALGTL